ncbi:DUF2141 domain-containing protein [Lutibacter sp. HS1-25]|uniref:DUF2141 domain-containing protein n=1 Tax=Lutibacter sp. HS1-25 TaxID=2485000 RepID=UPI0010126B51|nr:DUF2141 domain-containing protein [Lutibacter sp. HS1-25]RXP58636.1 DUF2141 domain-containing protein [Lutibacter sp. HS1-25]
MNSKKANYLLLLIFVLVNNLLFAQKTGTIEVIVNGIKNTDGQIMISINKGPEGWPESNFLEQRFIPNFTAPTFLIVFKDLPYGNYAIGLLHDEDKNGEITKNFIGMPKEGFAFSRNYNVVFRAPKYNEANFELDSPKKTITINIQD